MGYAEACTAWGWSGAELPLVNGAAPEAAARMGVALAFGDAGIAVGGSSESSFSGAGDPRQRAGFAAAAIGCSAVVDRPPASDWS